MCPGAAKTSPRAARPGGCGRVPVPTCEPPARSMISSPDPAGRAAWGPPHRAHPVSRRLAHGHAPTLTWSPALLCFLGGQALGPRVLTQTARRGSRGWTQWAAETGRPAVPGPASRGTGLVWSASWRAGRGAWAEGGRGAQGVPRRAGTQIVVTALCPLAKQEVPGALPAGCWPGLPAFLGTPSPQARGAGMRPRPGPGLSGPPAPHRRPNTPSPPRDSPLPGGSCLGPCRQPDQGEA